MGRERDKPRRPRRDWEPPPRAVLFVIAVVVALVVGGLLFYLVRSGSSMGRIGSFYSQPVE